MHRSIEAIQNPLVHARSLGDIPILALWIINLLASNGFASPFVATFSVTTDLTIMLLLSATFRRTQRYATSTCFGVGGRSGLLPILIPSWLSSDNVAGLVSMPYDPPPAMLGLGK